MVMKHVTDEGGVNTFPVFSSFIDVGSCCISILVQHVINLCCAVYDQLGSNAIVRLAYLNGTSPASFGPLATLVLQDFVPITAGYPLGSSVANGVPSVPLPRPPRLSIDL